MKSRLFSVVFDDRETDNSRAFARHLSETVALPSEVLTACIERLAEVRLARTRTATKRLVDQVVEATAQPRDKLEHALSVMSFFLDALLSRDVPKPDPVNWADDLETELGWLAQENRATFELIVKQIEKEVLPRVDVTIRRRRAAAGVLPTLESCGITVELRAVREDIYRWGTPLSDYEPSIIDVTPVASMHIGVDEGVPKDFYFQIDEDDVDYLVNTLQAAKKDIAALRSHLKLDS